MKTSITPGLVGNRRWMTFRSACSHLSLTLALLCCESTACAQESALRAQHQPDGVLVLEADTPVLFYQRTTKSFDGGWPRAGYVHPLYDLRGEVITEDFPEDHRHHRGVFWSWHQLYVGNMRLGDPWICKDIVWDVKSVEVTTSESSLRIDCKVEWKSPLHRDLREKMIPIVREQTRITVHPTTANSAGSQTDSRTIDFEISLTALVPGVKIGGSEDEKGYGGFSPRIQLTEESQFFSRQGKVEPTITAMQLGSWVNIVRPKTGLVIVSDQTNPRPSGPGGQTQWVLRQRRSMQNVAYPGREALHLSITAPLILRYQLIIHDGSLESEAIDAMIGQSDGKDRGSGLLED